jgi:hypothetical protein
MCTCVHVLVYIAGRAVGLVSSVGWFMLIEFGVMKSEKSAARVAFPFEVIGGMKACIYIFLIRKRYASARFAQASQVTSSAVKHRIKKNEHDRRLLGWPILGSTKLAYDTYGGPPPKNPGVRHALRPHRPFFCLARHGKRRRELE